MTDIKNMDLVQGVIAFKQAENASRVQMAVAAKLMQSQRDNGTAMIKLLDAATTNINQAGDALVAAATGLGGSIDTYA